MLVSTVSACTNIGNVSTTTRTVAPGAVSKVQASFNIGDGEIDIGGGADQLMHARFSTNEKRVPQVAYSVKDSTGSLKITQAARNTGFTLGPVTNKWAINLNDDIPLALSITSQSAKASLSLDTLTVNALSVNASSGETTVGLSGRQPNLTSVTLRSASGGIDLTMNGDYRSTTNLNVESASGTISADLSGKRTANLIGTVTTASGSITITVPKEIDVRITATTASGYVDASGFTALGQGAYDHVVTGAPATISLTIKSSSGNITLRTSK